MMSFQPAAVLLHTISAAIMGYGYELNQGSHGEVTEAWIQSQKGGHFQFLTIQG
jgi:hypothetical protein